MYQGYQYSNDTDGFSYEPIWQYTYSPKEYKLSQNQLIYIHTELDSKLTRVAQLEYASYIYSQIRLLIGMAILPFGA